ncbi:MAG: YchE family NAAT transporter [Anaerolineales bacterium]
MNWAEISNWTEYSKLFIGLFAIAGPLSAVPIFLGLTGNKPVSEKNRVALVAILTFSVTLLVFTYFGEAILEIFGISLAAFRVAGGILLLLSALDMMRSDSSSKPVESSSASSSTAIGIVPLAIPFLSGPGAISTVIIYASVHEGLEHLLLVSLVILSVALLVYLVFRMAMSMGSLLGDTANLVMNRVMGLIVASIAIEFIFHGLAEHFPDLTILH